MSTGIPAPAMLHVQRQKGSAVFGIQMGFIGRDITLADIRTAATALKFMTELDDFLNHGEPFPVDEEAKTSWDKISQDWPPVVWVKERLLEGGQ